MICVCRGPITSPTAKLALVILLVWPQPILPFLRHRLPVRAGLMWKGQAVTAVNLGIGD